MPSTPNLPQRLWLLGERAIALLEHLQPVAQLLARWYIASVFFRSGLTKLRDWDTTLALFADEYHVPLLNPMQCSAPQYRAKSFSNCATSGPRQNEQWSSVRPMAASMSLRIARICAGRSR